MEHGKCLHDGEGGQRLQPALVGVRELVRIRRRNAGTEPELVEDDVVHIPRATHGREYRPNSRLDVDHRSRPPSTGNATPVTYDASGLAR
jgi:hypothetical protein